MPTSLLRLTIAITARRLERTVYLFWVLMPTLHSSAILQLKKAQVFVFFNYQFIFLPWVNEAESLPPSIPTFSSDNCPALVAQGLFWVSCSNHHQCMPLIHDSDIMAVTGKKNVQEHWQLKIPHCAGLWGWKMYSFSETNFKETSKIQIYQFYL